MMPHGVSFTSEETQMGLRTGLCFYDKIRQLRPDLHVIILTNVADEEVEDWFRREEYCSYMQKPETFPYELADEVGVVMRTIDTQ